MMIPSGCTSLILVIFILIAFLPPKIPTVVRNIGIQLMLGGIIYLSLWDVMFELPNADKLPMSGLFGGQGDASMPMFNKYAFGFVAALLGSVFSVIVGGIRFLINRKKAAE